MSHRRLGTVEDDQPFLTILDCGNNIVKQNVCGQSPSVEMDQNRGFAQAQLMQAATQDTPAKALVFGIIFWGVQKRNENGGKS